MYGWYRTILWRNYYDIYKNQASLMYPGILGRKYKNLEYSISNRWSSYLIIFFWKNSQINRRGDTIIRYHRVHISFLDIYVKFPNKQSQWRINKLRAGRSSIIGMSQHCSGIMAADKIQFWPKHGENRIKRVQKGSYSWFAPCAKFQFLNLQSKISFFTA